MSSAGPPIPQPIYEIPEEPRELTAKDLTFISKYTGRSAEFLQRHILDVWAAAKKKVVILHHRVSSSQKNAS